MKKIILLVLQSVVSIALFAQTGTYSTINFPNTYTNTLTTGMWSGNFRSGFIEQSNGSLNYGIYGPKPNGFRFRWLAGDNTAIDYSVDTDQIMSLDNSGLLNIRNAIIVPNAIFGHNANDSYSKIVLRGPNSPVGPNSKRDLSFEFVSAGKAYVRAYRGNSWDTYLQLMTSASTNTGGEPSVRMHIAGNGYVGIGTETPQSLLAVNGEITAKKVKVTQTGWPDYVFNREFSLPSLEEVNTFIKLNHHLPNVPPAQEIEKNGLDIGEMQKIQMQKIEELTLYMIGLKQENELLKQKIAALEAGKQKK
ncbi:hypothetical protein [Chitinophaga sp. YIM B06452]|uniref:hypothetical protein n=1 Tax=Chitinophaga sp. YIM B06452 TaxID=3082158 RepID=UPI0031FEA19C